MLKHIAQQSGSSGLLLCLLTPKMTFLQCDLLFIIRNNNCGGNVFEIIAHKHKLLWEATDLMLLDSVITMAIHYMCIGPVFNVKVL